MAAGHLASNRPEQDIKRLNNTMEDKYYLLVSEQTTEDQWAVRIGEFITKDKYREIIKLMLKEMEEE